MRKVQFGLLVGAVIALIVAFFLFFQGSDKTHFAGLLAGFLGFGSAGIGWLSNKNSN